MVSMNIKDSFGLLTSGLSAPQWSLQNRPYVVTSKPAMGRFPELKCCTLPFAFPASLICEISRWRPIPPSKLEKNKKISFTGPWLHFLEVSHSSGRGFPVVFGAVLMVPPATWSSSSAARI